MKMTGRGRKSRNKSKTGTSVTTAMADEGCGDAQELSTVSNPVINNNSGTLLSYSFTYLFLEIKTK